MSRRAGSHRDPTGRRAGAEFGLAQLVDAGNVGVGKRGQYAGFAAEPFEIVLVEEMRMHQFQRNVALQSTVMRAIDRAHAALAERLEDFVRPQSTAGDQGHGDQGAMG